jgi:hypothetical protein
LVVTEKDHQLQQPQIHGQFRENGNLLGHFGEAPLYYEGLIERRVISKNGFSKGGKQCGERDVPEGGLDLAFIESLNPLKGVIRGVRHQINSQMP